MLDPFCGSGTTLMVANRYGRNGIGIELNDEYEPLIKDRVGEYTRIIIDGEDRNINNGYTD